MHLDFEVMNMTRADVVLGREWLYNFGETLSLSYHLKSFELEANGKKIHLQGECDMSPSPLIFSNELTDLVNIDQIKDLFSCYLMPYVESLREDFFGDEQINVFE